MPHGPWINPVKPWSRGFKFGVHARARAYFFTTSNLPVKRWTHLT